ncbi:hypothetical protein [Flavimaricola marinus]|uniref:Polysaccharide lyase n=1 Tax=Flavimaricola marinus TaxID=1819565 RepID=A0A238LJB2_9RHOB|nr:hypothetical protein [Flavimaricola marinus]SMY09056.1 hypothetical protein LOM8899_03218 [Flavimaricola marinus]
MDGRVFGIIERQVSNSPVDVMMSRAPTVLRVFLCLALLIVLVLPLGAAAQDYPRGMSEGRNSARSPTVSGGVVSFTVLPGDCQSRTYGDGRGESDCSNLNSKSYLTSRDVPVGTSMLYAFDVRVAGGLTHDAFRNPHVTYAPGGADSRLSVAIWQGELIKNHLLTLDLDRTRGLTVFGRTCAPASSLGDWTQVQLLLRWSAGSDGLLQLSCNDRPVYAVSGQPTDQQPYCIISNHCEPGVEKHPRMINAGFGIFFDAEVVNGVPTRPRVPASGLSVQMRDFDIRRVQLR